MIPAAVFNNCAGELLDQIDDTTVRAELADEQAYEHATTAFVRGLDANTKRQVIGLFVVALKRSWQIGIVFAGISVITVFFEKRTKLRKELETDFGLVEKKMIKDNGEDNGVGSKTHVD